MGDQERDLPRSRVRQRALRPITLSLGAIVLFICAVWGACSLVTWAVTNLPTWAVALIAAVFVAAVTYGETRT